MATLPERERTASSVLLQMGTQKPGSLGVAREGFSQVPPAAAPVCLPEPRSLQTFSVGLHSPSSRGWPEGPDCRPRFRPQPPSPSPVFPVLAILLHPRRPHPALRSLLSFLSACRQYGPWFQRGLQNSGQKHFVQNSKGLSPRMWSFLPRSPGV